MTLIATDAVVLHSADYLESSRILRVATREAGVQSVLARGARTSKKRFGSAMGLFAEGQAQIRIKPGRDLHTLEHFDVIRVRPELASDLGRFTAANAYAECVLRIVHEESAPRVYEAIITSFAKIASASHDTTITAALGALWQLVGEVGFTPTMDSCAECHASIDMNADAIFSHFAGGVLCQRCGARAAGGRRLPAAARSAIASWLAGDPSAAPVKLDSGSARAHQRLLREFISQHLPDNRVMRAYEVWESGVWNAPAKVPHQA